MPYSNYSSSSEEEQSPKRRKLNTPLKKPVPSPQKMLSPQKKPVPSPKSPIDEEDELVEEEDENVEQTGPAHVSPIPIVPIASQSPTKTSSPVSSPDASYDENDEDEEEEEDGEQVIFEFATTKDAVYHVLLENDGKKMTVNELYEEFSKFIATKRVASVTRDTVGRNATYLVRDRRLRSRAPRGSELYFWIPGPDESVSSEGEPDEDSDAPSTPVRKIRRRRKKKPKKHVRRHRSGGGVDSYNITISVPFPPHLLGDDKLMAGTLAAFKKWSS